MQVKCLDVHERGIAGRSEAGSEQLNHTVTSDTTEASVYASSIEVRWMVYQIPSSCKTAKDQKMWWISQYERIHYRRYICGYPRTWMDVLGYDVFLACMACLASEWDSARGRVSSQEEENDMVICTEDSNRQGGLTRAINTCYGIEVCRAHERSGSASRKRRRRGERRAREQDSNNSPHALALTPRAPIRVAKERPDMRWLGHVALSSTPSLIQQIIVEDRFMYSAGPLTHIKTAHPTL
ncbi:hypothetical protein WMY93_020948 [Mugilogobius chulae]|uniref:Uncharacterized protein n=1 Tax=Mugilogobius chulae TaxID=88201 RepID=A0AAW0NLI7_9GOBI